jgi:hypothetical protein
VLPRLLNEPVSVLLSFFASRRRCSPASLSWFAAAIALKLTGNIAPKPPVVKQEEARDRDKNLFDGEYTHDIEINDLRNRFVLSLLFR